MPNTSLANQHLSVSIGQFSSAGTKPENQDFHGSLTPKGSLLALKGITLAVADGISSSAVSAEASEIAIKSLLTDYYSTSDAWSVRTAATQVIAATNAWLYGQNSTLADINAGRVCTLSALIIKGRDAHVLHIGDSRIQRLNRGTLEPLTKDHRAVVSAEESYLARSLGAEHSIKVDYKKIALAVGDTFLLSTDGVHEFITASDVQTALAEPDLNAAALHLVDIALKRGSDDNLTVQIARIDQLPPHGSGLPLTSADLPIPSLPKPGEVIDGFHILRPLHTTARSHVFLATSATGDRVALKIPATESAQDTDYLRRFVMEEWIARRISSSNVVAAATLQEERTALFVATEYVEGTTLRQWMLDHPKPELEKVRGIVGQIAAGLRAFHRRDMIHQDLRPENIIIDESGTVKIIDLGSTSVLGVEEAAPGLLGEMPGTFQYTAPEYLSGDVVSWRSDQYSLGVIAYEMLTGRLPYGSQTARVRSRRDQMRLRYQAASDEDNGVPHWMDAALRRTVHPDPLCRYDALSESIVDLRRPGKTWRSNQHIPLIARNPLRFWQGLSAVLAFTCFYLASQLASQ